MPVIVEDNDTGFADATVAGAGGAAACGRRSTTAALRWVLVLSGLIHLPSLINPFFIDDYVYIDTVRRLDAAALGDLFTTSTMGEEASSVWWTPSGALPFYRPVGELTFLWDYTVSGLSPVSYHVTNLLLHVLCTWLVWRLGLALSRCEVAGLAAAAVFAFHPVHSEAVLWISGRFDLLVCACAVASVLAWLRWAAGGAGPWLAMSVGMCALGLFCKETALILPAVIFAGEALAWRGRRDWRRVIGGLVPFAVVAGLYLAGRFAMFDGLGTLPPPYGLDTSSPGVALRALAWNCAMYVLDFILWIQVDAIYLSDLWKANGLLFAAALLLCLGLVIALIRVAGRSVQLRVGFAWTALFMAPSLMAMVGERNVYLASVGVALAIGAGIGALWKRTADAPAGRARLRRGLRVVGGVAAVVMAAELGTMWVVASSGEKVIADVMALVPDPPADARIYVVNQCPLNAVGFEQALRLRYGRDDVRAVALTLVPDVRSITRDTASAAGPSTLHIRRDGGRFFESFVEQFHLFSRDSASDLAAAANRLGLTLVDPPESITDVRELELVLPLPLRDPRLVLLQWNNDAIRGRLDYLRLPWASRVEPVSGVAQPASNESSASGP